MQYSLNKIVIQKSLIVLGIVICSFSWGCDGKKRPVQLGNEEQILHKGNQIEPEDLDPQVVSGVSEYRILSALFEGLLTPDPVDLHPIPGVAQSWDVSEDGRIYTFHLRENARWSNGDPVTAQDFIFSYNRLLHANLGAPYAYRLYAIKGAEAYHKGKTNDFSTLGIKALDDYTLQIELQEPLPYFAPMITFMSWYPVHKDTILKHGQIDQRGTPWTRPGNMVSNGPFQLKNWEISKKLVVQRNPYYWNKDTVRLNEIHFHPIESHNTEERAFRAGQLHLTETIPLPKVATYKRTPYLLTAPFFQTYTYVFNTQKAPFNDKRVRQVLSLALDRRAIVENITKRCENPAYSFVPQGVAGYCTTAKIEENVERAREILAELGYPNGKGFPTVRLLYNSSDAHKSVAEALQHMWRKNLNIHVELENQEWKVFLRERAGAARNFNLARLGWLGDYMDPNAFLEIFTSKSGNNMSGWANAQYDHYIAEANKTLDQKKRFEYFDKAENLLMDELPVLPIYFCNSAYLIQPSVKNWKPNLIDIHPYNTIYLDASTN